MVLGIKNYLSACMSCCSGDLALLHVTALRLLKSAVREYIRPRINRRLYNLKIYLVTRALCMKPVYGIYGLTPLNQVNSGRGYRLHMRSRHRMTP